LLEAFFKAFFKNTLDCTFNITFVKYQKPDSVNDALNYKDYLFLLFEIPFLVFYCLALWTVVKNVRDELDLLKSSFMLIFSFNYDQTLNVMFSRFFRDRDIDKIFISYDRFNKIKDEISKVRLATSIFFVYFFFLDFFFSIDLDRHC
jgi:hypothetical protein